MTGSPDGGPYNYGRARVAGGLLLIGLVVILAIIDAISIEYSVDSIQLGLILGTGSVLLGVEAIRKYIGGS
jgi:hypothetical protein